MFYNEDSYHSRIFTLVCFILMTLFFKVHYVFKCLKMYINGSNTKSEWFKMY